MTRTKGRGVASRGASQEGVSIEMAERAFDNSFAPKKKKKKPTHLERLAECNISEELRVSIAFALKKLETSDEQKELELPSSLTSEERKYIHIVAQQMGFKSKSRGPRDCRPLTVSKKDPKEQPLRVKSWKRSALRYGGVEELMRQKEQRVKIRDLEREHERLLQLEESKSSIVDPSLPVNSGSSSPKAKSTVIEDRDVRSNHDVASAKATAAVVKLAPLKPVAGQPSRRFLDEDKLESRRHRDAGPFAQRRPLPGKGDRPRKRESGENRALPRPPRQGFNGDFRGGDLGRYARQMHPIQGGGEYPVPPVRDSRPIASVARPRSPLRPPKLEMDDSTWIMLNASDRPQPPQQQQPPPPPPMSVVQPPPVLYGQPFRVPEPPPYDRPFSHQRDVLHRPHEPNYAEVAGRRVPQRSHGPHYAAAASRHFHQHSQEFNIHGGSTVNSAAPNQHQLHDHYTAGDRGTRNGLDEPDFRYLQGKQSPVIPFRFGDLRYEYDPSGLVISPSEPAGPCYGYYTRGNEPRSGDTPEPGTAAQIKKEAGTGPTEEAYASDRNSTESKYNTDEVKNESSLSVPFSSRAGASLFERIDSISDLKRQERTIMSCVGVADADDSPSSEDEEVQTRGGGAHDAQRLHSALNRPLVRSDLQAPQHRTHSPRRNLPRSNREISVYELTNPKPPLHGNMRNPSPPRDSTNSGNWKREPSPSHDGLNESRWREMEREYLGIASELVGLPCETLPAWCTPKTSDEADHVAAH